ncbi:hypothetical protein RUND412_010014 [Rhizina undulata]
MEKSSKRSTKKGSAGRSAKNRGKSDDDEDLMHQDGVGERSGNSGKWRLPGFFGRLRAAELFKSKQIEQEHPTLRIRQEGVRFANNTFTTSQLDITTTVSSSILTTLPTEASSTAPADGGVTSVPNGSETSLQNVLSSTPPPSPAETSSVVTFPTTSTSTSSTSTSSTSTSSTGTSTSSISSVVIFPTTSTSTSSTSNTSTSSTSTSSTSTSSTSTSSTSTSTTTSSTSTSHTRTSSTSYGSTSSSSTGTRRIGISTTSSSLVTGQPSQNIGVATSAPAYVDIASYIPSTSLIGTTSSSQITSGSSVIVLSFTTSSAGNVSSSSSTSFSTNSPTSSSTTSSATPPTTSSTSSSATSSTTSPTTSPTTSSATSSTRTSSSSSSSTITSSSSSLFTSSTFSTSFLPSSTDYLGGGDGGTVVVPTDVSPTASPSATSGSSGSSSGPPIQNQIIGGVLGGLAGIALVLWCLLYLLRRWRRLQAIDARVEAGYGPPLAAEIQNVSGEPFAAAGGFFARGSQQSQFSETPERGFYKVAGRKLPPVIGGPRPEYSSIRSGTGSSIYPRTDDGSAGGIFDRSATPVSSIAGGAGPSRYSALTVATTSSGPAVSVTPIINSPISPMGSSPGPARIEEEKVDEIEKETAPPSGIPPAFQRQLSIVSGLSVGGKDGVGRSLPSHDGSRASRFTEDII